MRLPGSSALQALFVTKMPDRLRTLYRDENPVCCVKEPGVISEEPGMPSLIRDAIGAEDVFCVHRLDRETGGAMVYAMNRETASALSTDFSESGSAEKTYLAVITGSMEEKSGILRDLLFHDSKKNKSYIVDRQRKGVREASLSYDTLAETDGMSLVRIRLHSGRTHQIRVQFAGRNHPVAGDRRYGSPEGCSLALWASGLSFRDPSSGGRITVSSTPPSIWPWTLFGEDLAGKD